MGLSIRGTLLDNRRFLWTATVAFALAAIVFPLVVLAASGGFSFSRNTPNQVRHWSVKDFRVYEK